MTRWKINHEGITGEETFKKTKNIQFLQSTINKCGNTNVVMLQFDD